LVPSVAEIAWRHRTFAVRAAPNGSGMPRDLHMGEISREGDDAWCFRAALAQSPMKESPRGTATWTGGAAADPGSGAHPLLIELFC
jgi:hypothetical protein